MPRYYRHIRQGDQLIQDPDGIELPDLDAARGEALEGIRDILADAIRRGMDAPLDDAIVIMDEAGRELAIIPFAEALPLRLRRVLASVSSPDNVP
ncbi:DUF6894 family protein [Microvirga pakistanensis]|uniref:DUF6894 family protein n=1 Tax=Microvirga pakistanensis TaxID=1682650 RepID=UPI00106D1096|nr:hypothetical protein [Microvirga pakistanensis]